MSSNTIISETQFKEYNEILKFLADKNSLIYNYALHKTNRLMEDSISRPDESIEVNEKEFAIKAAKHLSDHKWECYDDSTIAQLELFLNVMSSVLYVLSQSVKMINTVIRSSFYKSLAKFWSTYRNTYTSSKVLETVVNVVNSEYFSALSSLTDVLDFEYSAGKWYNDWREMQQSNSENIKKFSKKLFKLSIKEFERVKEKNTSFRNIEYKVLKSGGEILGIGCLHLSQRILEEFFPQIKKYITLFWSISSSPTTSSTNITSRPLSSRPLSVNSIPVTTNLQHFSMNWSNSSFTSIPMTISSRPLSSYSIYSTRSTYTIHSTYSTHSIDSTHLTPPNSPGEKSRRFSFPKKLITTLSNPQKEHQQQRKQIKQIVEGVNKLFKEQRKIEHINEINEVYSKLSNNKRNKNVEDLFSELL
ncbi:hypothetical protein C1646_749377 [Rhizophagus diaphanus]|nr:hypothetical protein C1646_749377 [Rhizophagus diaphanus] [Rhizophagus sp. MUCL 43196]